MRNDNLQNLLSESSALLEQYKKIMLAKDTTNNNLIKGALLKQSANIVNQRAKILGQIDSYKISK